MGGERAATLHENHSQRPTLCVVGVQILCCWKQEYCLHLGRNRSRQRCGGQGLLPQNLTDLVVHLWRGVRAFGNHQTLGTSLIKGEKVWLLSVVTLRFGTRSGGLRKRVHQYYAILRLRSYLDSPPILDQDLYGAFDGLSQEWFYHNDNPDPPWYPYDGELLTDRTRLFDGHLELGLPTHRFPAFGALLQAISSTVGADRFQTVSSITVELEPERATTPDWGVRRLIPEDSRGRQYLESRTDRPDQCAVHLYSPGLRRARAEVLKRSLIWFLSAAGHDEPEPVKQPGKDLVGVSLPLVWEPTLCAQLLRMGLRSLRAGRITGLAEIRLERKR